MLLKSEKMNRNRWSDAYLVAFSLLVVFIGAGLALHPNTLFSDRAPVPPPSVVIQMVGLVIAVGGAAGVIVSVKNFARRS